MAGLLEMPQSEMPQNEIQQGEAPQEMPMQEEVSVQAKPVLDRAIELLYDENFENLVTMFEKNGEQGFAKSMSTAINGVLERLEQDQGEMPVEILAEVGTKLIEILLQDLVQGGVIQTVTEDMLMQAIGVTVGDWGRVNPDRANQQEFEQALQQEMGGV